MFFVDDSGNKELVYGAKPYVYYEMAILKLSPSTVKNEFSKSWEALFNEYHSLTAKEFTELSGMPRAESELFLDELSNKGMLEKLSTKNGALWVKQ